MKNDYPRRIPISKRGSTHGWRLQRRGPASAYAFRSYVTAMDGAAYVPHTREVARREARPVVGREARPVVGGVRRGHRAVGVDARSPASSRRLCLLLPRRTSASAQRTSSELKLNPQVHAVFLDGVYRDQEEDGDARGRGGARARTRDRMTKYHPIVRFPFVEDQVEE